MTPPRPATGEPSARPARPRPPGAARELLVAIGDLHGHAPALRALLDTLDARHGLRDGRGRLRAGVTLVFTGDAIDRGHHGLEVIALQRRLAAGAGRVVALLGNHEQLALAALDQARALLAAGVEDPVTRYERTTLHGLNGGGAFLREFGDTEREALAAYLRRTSPRGGVGRWLRRLEPSCTLTHAGWRILFVHAGLCPALRDPARLAHWDALVRARLRGPGPAGTAERYGDALLSHAHSPLWDRSFERLGGPGEPAPAEICRALGVELVVTGHTPHDGVVVRGGAIVDLDVGMTPAHGANEPQALVLDGPRAAVVGASGWETPLDGLAPAARAA